MPGHPCHTTISRHIPRCQIPSRAHVVRVTPRPAAAYQTAARHRPDPQLVRYCVFALDRAPAARHLMLTPRLLREKQLRQRRQETANGSPDKIWDSLRCSGSAGSSRPSTWTKLKRNQRHGRVANGMPTNQGATKGLPTDETWAPHWTWPDFDVHMTWAKRVGNARGTNAM